MSKLKLGILFGGKSEEHEVSLMSARSVYNNADQTKYEIYPIAVDKKGNWVNKAESRSIIEKDSIEEVPVQTNPIKKGLNNFLKVDLDVIFPLIHGPYGEDGKIQGFFDLLDIPYVGANVLGSAVGMDKGIMKKLFDYNNLRQTEFMTVRKYNDKKYEIINDFIEKTGLPIFIKPANLGSSIGISKVSSQQDIKEAVEIAFQYDSKIIIEKGIKAREIECSVLGKNKFKASLPGEIIPSHDFYDYQSKYEDEKTKLIIPADLDDKTIKEVQTTAIKAFEIIEGEGLARVDFFLKDEKVYINEINTIPGFTKYSMYPKLWEASGISYPDLIDDLVNIALEKN
ncbi:MAG TPA: D-alanine--D-alanine ligase family protein [Halanaerobiales bacterium]|nr:D-alanine--D-alanine ligase family protein [Halanaerobiales bacterium]